MYSISFGTLIVVLLCCASTVLAVEKPLVLPVWKDKVAGDFGTFGPERVRPPSDAPTPDAKWITSVTKPTISVFLPTKRKNTGVAMVICPGGGYWNLAWDLEGEEIASWLNSVGIAGIVLKYRVPRRPGQPEPLPAPGPLLDAQRAMRLVRSHATEWHIDPHRIGIVGFSAGGHLVISTASNFDNKTYEPSDEIDQPSCRPDFAVAVYPGYLEEKGTGRLAEYIHIPAQMPPVMLVHATDDDVASSLNSVVMYQALLKAGISSELHLYAKGGHGFGVRKSPLPCSTWKDRCVEWLRGQGFLVQTSKKE